MKHLLLLLTIAITSVHSFAWDMNAHVPSHNISQSDWNDAVASGEEIVIHGSNWTTSAKNIQIQDGVSITGDGMNETTIRLTASMSTSDFWFESIGHSYVTIKNIRFVGGSTRHFAAVFKIKTMGASSSTECTDWNFDHVASDSTWADCIQGGDKSAGETHHLINLSVQYCKATNIGNPSVKWLFDDNPSINDQNHFVNGLQTTWSFDISNNYVKDVCGDFVRMNLTGWQDATGFVPNSQIGNYRETNNTVISVLFFNEWLGNLANGAYVAGNRFINPTINSGLANTYNCNNSIIKDNEIETYCNRSGGEIRVVNTEFADKITIHQNAPAEYPGTERRVKVNTTYAVLATGSNNHFHPTITFDRTLPKYSTSPDVLRGIFIVGFDDVANKPATIDGKTYPHNWNFDGLKVYNGSGKVVYNEISGIPVSNIQLPSTVTIQTAYQVESVFELHNTTSDYGGYADGCNINLIGSPAAGAGKGILSVNRGLQGNVKTKFINMGMKVVFNSAWGYPDQASNLYETITAKQFTKNVTN